MSGLALGPEAVWSALGTAVVHFLWQGALLGCVTWAALDLLRGASASTRYAVAVTGLLLCSGAFATTLAVGLAGADLLDGGGAVALARPEARSWTDLAAGCWALGVSWMLLRFAVHCLAARRLRTVEVSPAAPAWQRTLADLQLELGVRRAVRLLRSGLAEVPMVVGWLSPVVLVPASAFTALTPHELRALLAHELAHIRRHDPLLNALQALVEIALFFHPAVWWISKQVRLEREFCCDDSAVRATGRPKLVAEALASLEALRLAAPAPDTLLSSNGGPLMQRITRILTGRSGHRSSRSTWHLPAGFLLIGLLAAAGSATTLPAQDATSPDPHAEPRTLHIQHLHTLEVRAQYESERAHAKLEAAVEAGQLKPGEVEYALARVKLHSKRKPGPHVELTSGEALARIGAYRRSVALRRSTGVPVDPKIEFAALQARVHVAVRTGELDPGQAKRRLEVYLRGREQLVRSKVSGELVRKRVGEYTARQK